MAGTREGEGGDGGRSRGGAPAATQRLWPLLVVGAGVLLGLGVAWLGTTAWRTGALLVGVSLTAGAVLRAVLPSRQAGLLQVRGKPFDVAVLLLAGAAVTALALAVPAGR